MAWSDPERDVAVPRRIALRLAEGGKRNRLPSALALARFGERILDWWRTAYLTPEEPLLPVRFGHEARASLPGLRTDHAEVCDPERVYAAVGLQRMRLRHDQQVPEWTG